MFLLCGFCLVRLGEVWDGCDMPALAFLHQVSVKEHFHCKRVRKVTDSDVRMIRDFVKSGMSLRQTGYKFDVSYEMVRKICDGRCYGEVL